MNPSPCIVCGLIVPQDALKASWGPVTTHFHIECEPVYRDYVAPRLRDAVVTALRRWYTSQRHLIGFQRSTTDRESTDQ